MCQALFTGNEIVKYSRYRFCPYRTYILGPRKVVMQKIIDKVEIIINFITTVTKKIIGCPYRLSVIL
jgi:hypothetical protein